jgi:hypothetical protein
MASDAARRLSIMGCLIMSLVAAAPAGLQPIKSLRVGSVHETQSAVSGNVRATVSFDYDVCSGRESCDSGARNIRVRILRSGRVAFDQPVADIVPGIDNVRGFDMRETAHESEPIVRLGFMTGRNDRVVDFVFDSQRKTYAAHARTATWREPLFGTIDVKLSGVAELLSFVVSYRQEEYWALGHPQVSISRNGHLAYHGTVAPSDVSLDAYMYPLVRDLDGDGEPEILFDATSRGMSCCSYSEVFWYDRSLGSYRRTNRQWGMYRDRPDMMMERSSGRTIFVTGNEDLTSRFTAECCSAPGALRIMAFLNSTFIDVTREYPSLIERDAWEAWVAVRDYSKKEPSIGDANLVRYLADKYMLREDADGWRNAQAAYSKEAIHSVGHESESDWAAFKRLAAKALREEGYSY